MTETSRSSLYSFGGYNPASELHGSSSQVDFSASSSSRHSSNAGGDVKDEDHSSPGSNSDLLLEKKRKNASAQAAFRARRTTYIANLEETVTSLETVVRKLQDACRDAHDDVAEMRQENGRLKALITGFEERERIWKAYAKATAGTPAGIAASSQLSAIPAASHPATHHHISSSQSVLKTPQSSVGSLHDHSASGTSFGEEGTVYGDDPYSSGKVDDSESDSRASLSHHNMPLFQLYPSPGQTTAVTTSPTSITSYPMDHMDHSSGSTSSLGGVPLTRSSSDDCHLSGLTSMAYSGTGDGIADAQVYVVDPNMPPPSNYSSNFSLSTYDLTDFNSNANGHRHSLPGSLTLDSPLDQTATADYTNAIDTSDPSKDSSRSRSRRHSYCAFPAPLPPVPRASVRNGSSTSTTKSGCVSDAAGGVSNALAVIKAQAFGNVRKTRARAKKNPTSGEAAKAALEILEARGLGLGLDISGGVKRRKRGDGTASTARG